MSSMPCSEAGSSDLAPLRSEIDIIHEPNFTGDAMNFGAYFESL